MNKNHCVFIICMSGSILFNHSLTNTTINKIVKTRTQTSTKLIVSQSGANKMDCSTAIPFWTMYLGVEGKNGPSSEHWAFCAITRTY